MFLSSLIEELCSKEENNKAGYTLTFRGQCSYCQIISESELYETFSVTVMT